jgi:hypothetical protein
MLLACSRVLIDMDVLEVERHLAAQRDKPQ